MSSPSERGERGFTLIEVLAAVLIVCLVFGVLLESVTRNLRDLSRAREDAHAAQVAEDRVRELAARNRRRRQDRGRRERGALLRGAHDQDLATCFRRSSRPRSWCSRPTIPGELSPSPLFTAARTSRRARRRPAARPGAAAAHGAGARVRPETDPNRSSRSSCWPGGAGRPAPCTLQQQIEQQQQQGQPRRAGRARSAARLGRNPAAGLRPGDRGDSDRRRASRCSRSWSRC